MDDILSFLEHHGVKGQKWGVRKKRSGKETRIINNRKKTRKNRRTLSDSEIKQYIERISSEKKLKSLIDEDLSPGKTVTKKILSESGQKVARTVISGAALYGIKLAVDKKFDAKEAAGFLAPKPKK